MMLEKNKAITKTAIETLDRNILVSASAGAGKTKLLIDRLIKRIVTDRVEVTSILALTFTEAAASEMKHRLQQAIRQQMSQSDDPFLRRQLSLIETASISTIHSFCLSIVKDYSYVLHLDPEITQNLLDEATKKTMFDQCLESVLHQAIQKDDDVFKQVVALFCQRAADMEPLKTIILDIHRIRSAKVDPSAWDAHVLSMYEDHQCFASLPDIVKNALKEDYLVRLNQLMIPVKAINGEVGHMLDEADMLAWLEISDKIKQSAQAITHDQLDQANRHIHDIATIKTKTYNDDEQYTRYRKQYLDQLKKHVSLFFDESVMLSDISSQKPWIKCLLQLSADLDQAFLKAKRQGNVMDFDDMEKFAMAILSDDNFHIDQVYRRRFSDVLVDEFQDTNDIQHDIITKVSRKDNVFRVGDIKQSIYRFRNAKPQLMRDMITKQEDLILYLPNNFRSSEDIVAFNNFIFDHLMNIPSFDDKYLKNDHVDIGLQHQRSKGIKVELDMIDHEITDTVEVDVDEFESDEDETEKTTIEYDDTTMEGLLKARHIANKMIQLYQQGAAFKDMCVLVRTHKTKSYLKQVFDEINIPYFIDTKSGFYHSQAIQDVLAFLRVLIDDSDEISLTGLSISPFFMLSFDDLATVAMYKKKHKISTWQAYQQLFPEIIDTILTMRSAIQTTLLSKILLQIYQQNDFYQDNCDEQSKINLDYLYEKAIGYDQRGAHGITRFLDIVKNLQDEISSEAIPIGNDEDVVKVMTIHQSKGLQFPIVFFWTNNRNTIMDLTAKVVVDPDIGVGMHTVILPYRYQRNNLIRMAIEFSAIKQELQEQIRLLYVGLTRAKDRMILVGLKNKAPYPDDIDQYMIYKRIGNGGWLYALFSKLQHPTMQLNEVKATKSLSVFEKARTVVRTLPKNDLHPILHPKEPKRFAGAIQLDFSFDLKPSERGTLMHRILADLIMDGWNKEVIENSKGLLSDDSIDQLMSFVSDPFTLSFKDQLAYSELPILMHRQNEYIKGYIDLLIQMDDRNIIVDFKTDVVKDPDELVSRYNDQLLSYAFAVSSSIPNVKTEAYIYSLHLKTYILIQS